MTQDPFRSFDRLASELAGDGASRRMPMDVYRRGDEVFVHLDLPGMDPESIDLTVERNVLDISARRSFDRSQVDQLLVGERPQGMFRRQVFLGDGLDVDGMHADYDGGVLVLRIPLHESARPRRIPVSLGRDDQAALGVEDHAASPA